MKSRRLGACFMIAGLAFGSEHTSAPEASTAHAAASTPVHDSESESAHAVEPAHDASAAAHGGASSHAAAAEHAATPPAADVHAAAPVAGHASEPEHAAAHAPVSVPAHAPESAKPKTLEHAPVAAKSAHPIAPVQDDEPAVSFTHGPESAAAPHTPARESSSTSSHAESAGHAAAPESRATTHDNVEMASLLRIGDAKLAVGDTESALLAFRQAARRASGDDLAKAFLGMARTYRRAGDGVKAIATYERLIQDNPSWDGAPMALLELGRALRENGAPKLALVRFYSVIHGTLKLPDGQADLYRRLVRTAQFEIAETHFVLGDMAEAARLFQRLDTMDLAPEDRAHARFRAAQAKANLGENATAVATLERMLTQDPDATEAPEAWFLLARLHSEAGRDDAALKATLDLLRSSQGKTSVQAWREWQRRAGEFLADHFMSVKDYRSAILVYRALDALDTASGWRAPLLFQIGICLERSDSMEEARGVYVEIGKLPASKDGSQTLAEWQRRAAWRGDQLKWTDQTSSRLTVLDAGAPRVAHP